MTNKFSSAEAVILAGGAGLRMGSSAEGIQKCLLPIDGEPILGHTLESLATALGSVHVTLLVSHHEDQVYDYVKDNTPHGVQVDFLHDNGHSRSIDLFRSVKNIVPDTFLGSAGDIVVKPDIYRRVYEAALGGAALVSTAMAESVDEVNSHAIGRVEKGKLVDLEWPPRAELEPDHLRDMTIWGMNPEFHDYADQFPDLGAVPQLLGKALCESIEIPAEVYEDRWVHLAYAEDLTKTMQ